MLSTEDSNPSTITKQICSFALIICDNTRAYCAIKVRCTYRPFSYCIDQAGLDAFTVKSGHKHYNPPPLTVM